MRISDWSSDVCSSDLRIGRPQRRISRYAATLLDRTPSRPSRRRARNGRPSYGPPTICRSPDEQLDSDAARDPRRSLGGLALLRARLALDPRSEEHTSELQSLMRISYAVFCLQKKNSCVRCTYASYIIMYSYYTTK